MIKCNDQPVNLFLLYILFLLPAFIFAQEQLVDLDFNIMVDNPAYSQNGPVVAIDEAHENFHTASGQYKPFADLLSGDGYIVKTSVTSFLPGSLDGFNVLVIANALPQDSIDLEKPAFSEEECDVVQDWVREGGSLLLIADHAPFGRAAENLAGRFGVTMGKGYAFEVSNALEVSAQLLFSAENGLLGNHSILNGRSSQERIDSVMTFTGQSLTVPDGASALFSFSGKAREAASRTDLGIIRQSLLTPNTGLHVIDSLSSTIDGRAQGIAIKYGSGRVVVLGEAGFLSAQLIRWPDGQELRFGMNVAGNDNRQFALNVMHWLSRLID